MQLFKNIKVTTVVPYTATGTTAVNGTALDMSGFEGVIFVAHFGSTATDISMKAQGGATSSPATDLLGTSLALDATAKTAILSVEKPLDRYIRVVLTRTTTTIVGSVIAIQYGSRTLPISNVVSDNVVESHISPAAGTA
jgi:hypothetical protein